MMRTLIVVAVAVLSAMGMPVYAGPAEDIVAMGAERGKAFEQGNLDAYMEAFADNVAFTPSFQGYRVDGKKNLRQFFADLFQSYPKRKFFGRQGRVFAFTDNLAAQEYYGVLRLTDEKGATLSYPLRGSLTWVKLDGRWQIAEQHNSRIPGAD